MTPALVEQYIEQAMGATLLALAATLLAGLVLRKWAGGVVLPGWRAGLLHFLKGCGIGIALPAAILMIVWAGGEAEFMGFFVPDVHQSYERLGWGWFAVFMFLVSLLEESLMRGAYLIVPFSAGMALLDYILYLKSKKLAARGNRNAEDVPLVNIDAATMEPFISPLPQYPLKLLGAGYGRIRNAAGTVLFALLLSFQAVYFALAHAGNPSATPAALVNIGLAGVFFAMLVYFAGSFYTALGVHFAWNFSYEIFDLPVSGYYFNSGTHIVSFDLSGSGALGGGAFGLEGGFAMTAALVTAITFIALRVALRAKPAQGKNEIKSPL